MDWLVRMALDALFVGGCRWCFHCWEHVRTSCTSCCSRHYRHRCAVTDLLSGEYLWLYLPSCYFLFFSAKYSVEKDGTFHSLPSGTLLRVAPMTQHSTNSDGRVHIDCKIIENWCSNVGTYLLNCPRIAIRSTLTACWLPLLPCCTDCVTCRVIANCIHKDDECVCNPSRGMPTWMFAPGIAKPDTGTRAPFVMNLDSSVDSGAV